LASEQEQKRVMLFPIRLDDSVMEIKTGWPAHIKNTRHIGDFTQLEKPQCVRETLSPPPARFEGIGSEEGVRKWTGDPAFVTEAAASAEQATPILR
jgi:hypothetical protein